MGQQKKVDERRTEQREGVAGRGKDGRKGVSKGKTRRGMVRPLKQS